MNEHQKPESNLTRTSPVSRPSADEQDTEDYYFENGLLVFTAAYHLKRGACCGSGCKHCPFEPSHLKGATTTPLQRKAA